VRNRSKDVLLYDEELISIINPTISVLIPTYEEKDNIKNLIESIHKVLSNELFEIIVIDDNSPDGTSNEVIKLSQKYDNIKLILRPEKMGLGSAYKDGFKASSGDFIVEMDADMSHNPKDILRLLKGINSSDISIGSRYIDGGKIIGWNWKRRLISWGANHLVRLFLGIKAKDVTSGFRIYRRKAFLEITKRSTLNGFNFQIEVLYIANNLGLKVEEVPITFTDRKIGKSKLNNEEISKFLQSIFKIRISSREY